MRKKNGGSIQDFHVFTVDNFGYGKFKFGGIKGGLRGLSIQDFQVLAVDIWGVEHSVVWDYCRRSSFSPNANHRPTAAAINKTPDKTQHEWNTGTDGVPMFSYSQVLLLLTLVPASPPTREGRNNPYQNAPLDFRQNRQVRTAKRKAGNEGP